MFFQKLACDRTSSALLGASVIEPVSEVTWLKVFLATKSPKLNQVSLLVMRGCGKIFYSGKIGENCKVHAKKTSRAASETHTLPDPY